MTRPPSLVEYQSQESVQPRKYPKADTKGTAMKILFDHHISVTLYEYRYRVFTLYDRFEHKKYNCI